MWLMTPFGFFSVVCARLGDPRGLHPHPTLRMIRARNKAHLEALRKRYPGLQEIITTKGTDYPHRIMCESRDLFLIMQGLVQELDYCNFKTKAKAVSNDEAYVHFLHTVWGAGLRLTPPAAKQGGHGFFGDEYEVPLGDEVPVDEPVNFWDQPEEVLGEGRFTEHEKVQRALAKPNRRQRNKKLIKQIKRRAK